MKTLNTISSLLIFANLFGPIAKADEAPVAEYTRTYITSTAISTHIVTEIAKIRSQHLSQESIKETNVTLTDSIKVILGLSRGTTPSQEGIPQSQFTIEDLNQLKESISTVELLIDTLKDSKLQPSYEDKRKFYEAKSFSIVKLTEKRQHEELIRMILNRSADVANAIIQYIHPSPVIRDRILVRFYEENFKFAIQLAQASENLNYRQISLAEFGRMYNRILWRFSANASFSPTAEALLLLKSVGYLGYDLNYDSHKSEKPLQAMLAKVVELQLVDPSYQNVLKFLESNTVLEDDQSIGQVNPLPKLRFKIYNLLKELPRHLLESGVELHEGDNLGQ